MHQKVFIALENFFDLISERDHPFKTSANFYDFWCPTILCWYFLLISIGKFGKYYIPILSNVSVLFLCHRSRFNSKSTIIFKKSPTFFMTGTFWFNLWLLGAAAKYLTLIVPPCSTCTGAPEKKLLLWTTCGTCGVHNQNSFMNYLSKIGGDQSPKPHTFRRLCMHHVCLQIWMYGLYWENQVGKELGDLGLHTRLLGLMAAPFWCTMH